MASKSFVLHYVLPAVAIGIGLGYWQLGREKKADQAATARAVEKSRPAPTQPAPPVAAERDRLRADVVEGLNTLFKQTSANASAIASGDDLVVRTSDACDRELLANLRKSMTALDLDPARGFATMRCASGWQEVVLELR